MRAGVDKLIYDFGRLLPVAERDHISESQLWVEVVAPRAQMCGRG
jgi:hypothetical protein